MIEEQIERNYLEIKSKSDLEEVKKPNLNCEVSKVYPPDFQLNKFFYKQIGNKYRWKDRLVWNDKEWIRYLNHPGVKTYVIKDEGELIGYFEQIIDKNKSECEIAYFGILETYFGKSYGGYLLSEAIKNSFNEGVKRVWVHTCSLDHKNAINNYLARGMKIFKSEKIKINSY